MTHNATSTLGAAHKQSSVLRRLALPLLAGAALWGVSATALAGPGAQAKRGSVCDKLSCTDAQREELRAVAAEAREDSKAARAAIKRLRADMAQEWAKETPDEAKLAAVAAKVQAQRAVLAGLAVDALMELHEILDSKQRAMFAKAIERRGVAAVRGSLGKHGKRARPGKGAKGPKGAKRGAGPRGEAARRRGRRD